MADALVADGWSILDRNWRGTHGELDLVVGRGRVVRFVEVKARDPADESALEAIDGLKVARLVGAAEAWLVGKAEPEEMAFLVAVVSFDAEGWTIEWFDDAF